MMPRMVPRATLPLALAATCYLLAAAPASSAAENAPAAPDGLSDSSQSIHQELRFAASCARVYAALTTTEQFNAVTLLTDGRQLLAAAGAKRTLISPDVGGSFTLFGGYITGRNLQMQPGRLLAQAWRTGAWAAGQYSVVRFALSESGAGCALLFDHRGFPDGEGTHLARGWYVHYWDPLHQLLEGS